jgi:hypothetical protein
VAPSNSGKTVLAKNISKQTDGMFKITPRVLKEKNKVSFIFYLQSKFYCHKCIFEKEHDE